MLNKKIPTTDEKDQISQDTYYMSDEDNSEGNDVDEFDGEDVVVSYMQPIPLPYEIPLVPKAIQDFLSAIADKKEKEAIALLDNEEIQAFVKAHINSPVNCKPNGGMAPTHQSFLMFASENGLPDLAEKLIEIGADINLCFDPMLLPMHDN